MREIVLDKVSKTYDKQSFAVEDVEVSIRPGEFFVLVGPSGCGKSTLLRMLAGLEEISAGSLSLGGKLANHLPPNKREISMVFQNYALYPHLSVEENIMFGLKVRKISKQERKRRVQEAATMLGLSDYLKRKPRELSGGQRQRVALARTVVSQAPICLMDEPLSNLDAQLRGQMRVEIRQLQQQLGMTMIYVTHDQVEAMTMGDRIMVLRDGKVQQIGTPLEIYNQPVNKFVAEFIGSPPMNMARASIIDGRLVAGNELSIKLSQSDLAKIGNRSITLGIRPEHIHQANGQGRVRTTLLNVEILGNETLLAFNVNNTIWKAKWPGQWQLTAGSPIELSIDREQIFIFDEISEEVVSSPFNKDTVLEGVQTL